MSVSRFCFSFANCSLIFFMSSKEKTKGRVVFQVRRKHTNEKIVLDISPMRQTRAPKARQF